MDVRRVGIWMVVFGAVAMIGGLAADAIQNANESALAQREGIFDLSGLAHATFFAGICVAVIGVILVAFGHSLSQLYASGARVTVQRRLAQVGAPVAAIALVAGCAAAAGTSRLADATAPQASAASLSATPAAATGHEGHTTPTTFDASQPHSHDANGDSVATVGDGSHGAIIAGTATGDSPCEQAQPEAVSPGQVGAGAGGSAEATDAEGGHGGRGMVLQIALTQDERKQLEQEMIQARTVVDRFPTVKDALAGGYEKSTPYVPCIGAHYTNTSLAAKFDPTAPSELLYDGTADDAKLVGLSYLVYHPNGAPEGFAGENDHWHQHNFNGGLCMQGGLVIGAESTTKAECEALGGHKQLLEDIWMMHAWVVPGFECSWGVFSGECPELGGKIGGTAWDA